MKRFFHIARITVATLSLFLCLFTLAAWIRSYFTADSFSWTTRQSNITAIAWGMGHLDIVHLTADQSAFVETDDSLAFERPKPGFEYQHKTPESSSQWGYGTPERDWHVLGLHYRSGKVFFMRARAVSLPFWMLALVLAVPPLVWLVRHRGNRSPGACPVCGYDLRATPERCPECGMTPPENDR